MSAIRSLWPFIRPYKRYLCIGGLLAALEVLVNLAQPWPLKWIVDDLTHATPTGTTSIALSCLAFGLIVGTTAILDYWSTRILSSTGLHLANSVREATFSHLNRLSLRFHGNHRVGDLTTRITSDADRAQDMVVQGLAVLAPNAMLLVGMATIMIVLDPTFALLALALTPLLAFVVQHSSKALKRAERLARTAGGEVASAATETLSAMPLIQAYTLEDSQNERVVRLSRHSLDAGLDAVRHQARFSPAVDASAALSIIGVLWFGAIRVRSGVLTVGELLVFVSYVGSVYKPMKALSKLGRVISKGEAATQRIIEVLDEQPQIADRPTAAPARRLHGSIDFADVSFRYGPGAETVLSHVTLSIEAGQTVALVGPTGAGKTTVASLVPRLIEASSGSVLLDGIDVRDYTLRSIREQVSIVLQDSVLLHGTIRHNIALGRRGATTRDVERAAGLALVDEFANRLPLGLDTPIGERGANLSGGQRQRIAIARAILRDAPILILDEPTSALDGASETLIVESLDNLPANRTTIIIAHRLSTVRRADRILVVDGGCIVEDGSHDALTRLGGRYARLLSPEPTGLTSLLSTTGVAR